jgi:hypothetical protein
MNQLRRQLLGLGVVAASSLVALHAAQAMNGPTAIQIDGGPLGQLQISGGFDGYGYYLSNTTATGNLPGSDKADGAELANALIEVQKTSGILQFTLQVGANGGTAFFGTGHPGQSSISTYTTGPLRAGYVTIAPPNSPFTVSVGQLGSLEGWESGVEWNNANQLTTEMFYVENSQSRGAEIGYNAGPVSATILYGDGYDTGVFNFLEAIGTYTFNANNNASIYYGGNLGTTGTAVKSNEGPVEYQSSQMLGGFYSYTTGNLNLVPEVQYQYAKADQKIGIVKPTYNFGAAVFADYSFGATSPYSVGAWGQYFTSHASAADGASGVGAWYIGADNEGVAFSVTPTWQYKDLFARADAGYVYLLRNKTTAGATYGYGDSKDHGEVVGLMEAGLLF